MYSVEACRDPRLLQITFTLRDLAGPYLDLRGYSAAQAMQVVSLEARNPNGGMLRISAQRDTTRVKGQVVDLPRFRIYGPLPPVLTVHYTVVPGRREGDDHMGYSGRCFSYLGSSYGVLSGRELFLVPEPTTSVRGVRVRFQLPEGWRSLAPWRRTGHDWKVPATGSDPVEHLISSPLGLGQFAERGFVEGRTHVRLAFAPGLSHAAQDSATLLIHRGIHYIRTLMGRDLGAEYLLVLMPDTPDGYEVMPKAWATGQAGSFIPLTAGRMRELMREYLRAYVQYAPYRHEVRRKEDLWLVDAVANWYSLKATAAAGLGSEQEMTRALGLAYLTGATSEDIDRNLENLYASGTPNPTARDAIAPFVLFFLDHQLRERYRLSDGVDGHIRKVFSGSSTASFWSLLPETSPHEWDDFRRRYVRGGTLAPVPDLVAETPTSPLPIPPGSPPIQRLTLLYTGNGYGYIENCGCKSNQSGGIARRATVIDSVRTSDPEALLLDAGNAFTRPDAFETPSPFAIQEQRLYLEAMDQVGYDACAVGMSELARGLEYFHERTRGLSMPFLCANVANDGTPLGSKSVILQAHGRKVGVIGVLEPPRGGPGMTGFDGVATGLQFSDPVIALQVNAVLLHRTADVVIALGRLSPSTVRRVARECPAVDIVISTDYETPVWTGKTIGSKGRLIRDSERPGFVGRTLALNASMSQYGLTSAQLGLDRAGRVVSAKVTDHWLYESVPDEPRVRRRLDRFYDRIGRTAEAQVGIRSPLVDEPQWRHRAYVGALACKECHAPEYTQWKTTGHAGAYKTLLDRHRHYQPVCISCHVVGFGSEYGYKLGQREEPLGNVQCEDCHGPGAEHVRDPSTANIQGSVPERVCLACHTPDHSNHFVYSERLLRVQHRGIPRVALN